jgi:hypothetical protein
MRGRLPRVGYDGMLDGGAPASRERPRTGLAPPHKIHYRHRGEGFQPCRLPGASGAPDAERSRIQFSACGATFNAWHHPPPDNTTQATPQDARLMRGALRAVGCIPLLDSIGL